MPLGRVTVPLVPLRSAVLTQIQVRHGSLLLVGTHGDLDVTFDEGGSVFSAVSGGMCQATENGQGCCKDRKAKNNPNSLETTDVEQILATGACHLMLMSQPPFWYILSEGE